MNSKQIIDSTEFDIENGFNDAEAFHIQHFWLDSYFEPVNTSLAR